VKTTKQFMIPDMVAGVFMKRFVAGVARDQGGLFPGYLDNFVGEDIQFALSMLTLICWICANSVLPPSKPAPPGGLASTPQFS